MGFHIGQQNAGVINNVEGDQVIHGPQQGTFVSADPGKALEALRVALDGIALPRQAAEAVTTELGEVTKAIQSPEPDKPRAAGALERLTGILKSCGALVLAGTGLLGPLGALGQWLGPLGAGLLKLLPGR